ncbi:MAG: hypothetical protein JSS82_15615 [Bacteroidetes bacterium]|nr:hypothetical protein [Bacteroidota bacterium]
MIDLSSFDKPRVPDKVSLELLYFSWRMGQNFYGPRCQCSECLADYQDVATMFQQRAVCPSEMLKRERGKEAAVELASKYPEPDVDEVQAAKDRENERRKLIHKQFPKW